MFTHDFKGPLTVISGYGELVLENLVGEERESVSIILSQVRRLATLADYALALAKAQSTGFALERMPGELVAFVRELIIVAFGPQSERIVLQPRIDDVWLNFDPHALRHVLENVIGNALKYSDDEVSVEVLRERNEVAVIVRDHGIGIPADELVHVFGRFARASNARRRGISGSGVGLYIANRIVEEHGGAIFVSSSEGEGSTFEVRLPLAP
jgi:signal transduction histidine kinase